MNPNRNGLGDDSYFIWPDSKIPFKIGSGFNETNQKNILDSVEYYNNIFGECVKWVPRSDEVKLTIDVKSNLRNEKYFFRLVSLRYMLCIPTKRIIKFLLFLTGSIRRILKHGNMLFPNRQNVLAISLTPVNIYWPMCSSYRTH